MPIGVNAIIQWTTVMMALSMDSNRSRTSCFSFFSFPNAIPKRRDAITIGRIWNSYADLKRFGVDICRRMSVTLNPSLLFTASGTAPLIISLPSPGCTIVTTAIPIETAMAVVTA